MRTAWSDKHAIYSSFNGPGSGGKSIDDFFAPEIDSQAVEPNGVPYPTDTDWAHDDAATKQYDGYKVQAVINEIDGYDHSGTPEGRRSGDPRDELPDRVGRREGRLARARSPRTPNGTYTEGPTELAGYFPGTTTPRPLLASALDYVNEQLRRMVDTIRRDGLAVLHGDHHHGQARSVAAESAAAEADRGRADHQRDQRGLDREDRRSEQPDRRRHRRRPVAELPVGQDAGTRPTSSRTTCGTTARRRCSTTTTA